MKVCVLPGDGIGPEIIAEAVRVLKALDLKIETEEALLGGCAVDANGDPYPDATQKLAQAATPRCRAASIRRSRKAIGSASGFSRRIAFSRGGKACPTAPM